MINEIHDSSPHMCADFNSPRLQFFFMNKMACLVGSTRFSSHLRCALMIVIKFFMTCSSLHWMMLAIDTSFSLRHKAGEGLSLGDRDYPKVAFFVAIKYSMARHDVYSSESNDSERMNSTIPKLYGVNF
jgi:hypothetical protein